jgi:spore coat polysaccharide biosynthesis protein SpsF
MIDCIIQARTGSTRFPNKILNNITQDKNVLEFLLDQLQYSKLINKIIVATTISEKDDSIVDLCKNKNIKFFRGDELNVLKRYYDCAQEFHSQNILRITSDCPLIDPELVDNGIEKFLDGGYDYITNSLEETFPHGLDFQILKFDVLKYVFENAELYSEKEHVIPYILNNPGKFKIYNIKNEKNFSNFRITVDWPDDLELIKKIIERTENRPILMKNIVEILNKNPELMEINSGHSRNELTKK